MEKKKGRTWIWVCLFVFFIILINRNCLMSKYLLQLLVESIIYSSSASRRREKS